MFVCVCVCVCVYITGGNEHPKNTIPGPNSKQSKSSGFWFLEVLLTTKKKPQEILA